MATAFASPDHIVEAPGPAASPSPACLARQDLEEVFELARCQEWVQRQGYSRVCLQFPDPLLHEAVPVAAALKEALGQEVYILGDTTYGACCVDEVAAAHTNADCVIHFGHTCLTPARTLPVLYVFTRAPLSLAALAGALADLPADRLLLLWDVEYEHCLGPWTGGGARVVRGLCSPGAGGLAWQGRRLQGVEELQELQGATVVYVGRGEETLLNFVHSLPQHEFLHWDSSCSSLVPAGLAVGKLLMRRYFLVEKAKDAERVGLLVGTLGMERCTEILDKLRQVIKAAGKRVYTFLVGKPNVAKLANFPEIDVFVLVACPELSFIDSRDFLQPVVTPWEIELACRRDLEWTGEYITDYRALLSGGSHYAEAVEGGEVAEREEGDMSLVTGRLRRAGLGDTVPEGEGELMVLNDKTVAVVHEGGGGQFLAGRAWAGLEPRHGDTEVAEAVQGPVGIAAGYSTEPTL